MQIEGVIDYIAYPKAFKRAMEWAVLQIKTNQGRVKAVGEIMPCKRGEVFVFDGDFQTTSYGKEFKFEKAIRSEQGEKGAESYLAHLFGSKTSQKIIKHFKSAEESLKIFKEDSNLLLDVKGISVKTIKKAKQKHQHHQVAEVLFTELKPYGMTLHNALKIYKKYGNEAIDKIKKNPYRLMFDLEGFGFDACDLLAAHFNISPNHPNRVDAGIFHTMKRALMSGHTFLPVKELLYQSEKLLSKKEKIAPVVLRERLMDLQMNKRLVGDVGGRIYLPHYHQYEIETAKHFLRILGKNRLWLEDDEICDKIEEYEQLNKLSLAKKQTEAIIRSCQNQFSIITGPPGSGKTTIINAILYCLEKLSSKPLKIGLAAPTGKAAKRMSETTRRKAFTMHKLLQVKPQEKGLEFEYNKYNPVPYDVVIVDEVSMMDLPLTCHFLEAIPKGCQVIWVGDKDQLPSVGAGQVLADLLESKVFPVTVLDEIYRQKQGSTILERALDVSKGNMPSIKEANDFTFFEHDDILTLQEEMIHKFYQAVQTYGMDEVVILTPMRKTPLGVEELNRIIQMDLNPASKYKREVKFGRIIFREGDKVIQVRPNEDYGLVNGQIGYIETYVPEDPQNGEEEMLIVDYDGEKVSYTRDRFDELAHAWCLTIHKSQGSEWKSVFIPVCAEHSFMLRKRLIYTAMTRAKENLGFYGMVSELRKGVVNHTEPPRNSLLKDRIRGIV
ncbi:ATP-dependent RecD-like DNA helicase [Neobacillus sp. YIM B02564]|uniref:ATP-dependent RecD-like DNA helicase n=1 Tax=Neobacillus paridis TaxID=2803862 RepID=A0ABS1TLA1_9BACI|nr:ATP-dependent RecD-like DNA helicase [Neobacillus paridis]MBL4952081.1 ATP-dependent RecD-like DNA helicase [Neobacillus paridis]